MEYKKIIKSRELRLRLLKYLDLIPDKYMVLIQYKVATGNRLDLKNPKRYSEKIQWYKLYYRNPLMKQCADKNEVRKYIRDKGYEDIIVPQYGVYDNENDIIFEELPEKFVLKTTNGGGNNNIILCLNKENLDIVKTRLLLRKWLNAWSGKMGREWVYYDTETKIICEKYLETNGKTDLVDYKFVCFNGNVEYIFVNSERQSETGISFGIYNSKFEELPYRRKGLKNIQDHIVKPDNFEKMIEIAQDLSKDFPHVRVDLYNIEGKIFFGELTFFHGSGYIKFDPDEFDFILGEKFNI